MLTAIKKCRVCGKEYESCRSARSIPGVYRWQEVACCAEHGQIYLARILESRMKSNDAIIEDTTSDDKDKQNPIIEIDIDEDDFEEDEEDDNESEEDI